MADAKDGKKPETVKPSVPVAPETPRQPRIKFDTAGMKSSYCNVVNATSTREEVVLNFGLNDNWEMASGEVDVQLLHRIIISPFTAERLRDLLTKLLTERAARFGNLNQTPT